MRIFVAVALLAVCGATPARAGDLKVELGVGDDLVVEDSGGTERMRFDQAENAMRAEQLNLVAADPVEFIHQGKLMIGADGGIDHFMGLYRTDLNNGVVWMFDGGGAIRSSAAMIIDGHFQAFANPTTGVISPMSLGLINDPDSPPNGTMPTMLQIGPDVETGILLETNNNAFPSGYGILVVDQQNDFRWALDNQNRLRWGPDGEPGRAALDVTFERVEDGGNAYLRATSEGGDTVDLKRQANIADPSGGSTVDVECRAALGQVLDLLEGNGMMAP